MSSGRPIAKLLDHAAVVIATGFGIGFIPKAPGTWGSLLGLGLGWGLHSDKWSDQSLAWTSQVILLVALSIFGLWAIARTERLWQVHDSGKIVWDEVIGQAIPMLFIEMKVIPVALVFLGFRLLDIWKPGPIGWADEKLPGALGTFLDDIIAGVLTAIAALVAQSVVA